MGEEKRCGAAYGKVLDRCGFRRRADGEDVRCGARINVKLAASFRGHLKRRFITYSSFRVNFLNCQKKPADPAPTFEITDGDATGVGEFRTTNTAFAERALRPGCGVVGPLAASATIWPCLVGVVQRDDVFQARREPEFALRAISS